MKQVIRMMKVAATVASKMHADGWSNIMTGLGFKGKDKRMSMDYNWCRFTETELEHLYAVDSGARRAVDYVPEQGTKEWIELKMTGQSNPEAIKAANSELERLLVKDKFKNGWSWARLYGGAGILVSVDDGKELSEPLDLNAIRSVKALTVLNRFELLTSSLIDNLEDPEFGLQEIYDLAPRSVTDKVSYGLGVHHSRIIRFNGLKLPRTLFEMNDHWDDSILPKLLNALRNYNMAHDSLAAALGDFRVMIIKLKNLADMVGSDDDQALMTRLQLMQTSKSVLNSVAIDADSEEITNLDTNFTNLDKVLEKVESRLVADSDLPHTIMLGEGAQGTLSGGGESEDRNEKSFIAGQQSVVLTKPIDRILQIIQSAKQGPFGGQINEELSWCFKPLWELSDKEKAEVHKTQAEADAIYHDLGVLSQESIAKSRFGSGEYSTETQIDEAYVAPKPNKQTTQDEDELAYDHAHSGWIEGVGYYFTSGANGDGDNHTHQLPNGVDTGPRIPLFGGGHMHQIDHENYTGPSFPLQVATEAQAVMASAKEDKPAMVELELDLKTGKLKMKTISADRLYSVMIENNEYEKLKTRFDGIIDASKTMTTIFQKNGIEFKKGLIVHPTNIKGVKVVLGERK